MYGSKDTVLISVCMYTLISGGPIGYWLSVYMYVCMHVLRKYDY